MKVDVSCRICGGHARIDLGQPGPGQTLAEHLHVVEERLRHRPSFECFGGHLELEPPLPDCWLIDWSSVRDD